MTGRGVAIEREVLIAFDLLLVLVLGPAALFRLGARPPIAPPDAFDVLQVVLVASALFADAVALWAIARAHHRVRLHAQTAWPRWART